METFNFETFNYDEALKEVMDGIKKPNILLCGATGVGKSSLVNDIFDFSASDLKCATVGEEGRPETIGVRKFTSDDSTINLYDSEGYEIGKVDGTHHNRYYDVVISYIDKLKKEYPADMEKHIHEVWYCISAANKRFLDIDEQLIREIRNKKVPLMVLITKVDAVDEGELNRLISSIRTAFCDIHIYTYSTLIDNDNGAYERYVQKPEIVKWALDNLDESLQLGFLPAVKGSLKERRKIVLKNCVVPYTATAAATVVTTSFIPVPFSDSVPLMAIQVKMSMSIIKAFGIKSSGVKVVQDVVGTTVVSSFGKKLASQLLSIFPIFGSIVKAAVNVSVATSVTAVLGAGITILCEQYLTACVKNGGAENLSFQEFFNQDKLKEAIEYVQRHKSEFGIDDIIMNASKMVKKK